MARGYQISLAVNLLLLATVAVMAWLFLVRGNVVDSSDDRTAILVTQAERNKVMGDMRAFLEAVQTITEAGAAGDISGVAKAARAVGSSATGGESTSFMGKLPLEMKTLGFATHGAFDTLAQNAEASQDANAALAELGDLMLNCTACHASYSFVVDAAAK